MNKFSIISLVKLTNTLVCILLLTSCSKTELSTDIHENQFMNISLDKIESEDYNGDPFDKSASTIQPQKVEIPINNELSAYLTLEEENNTIKNKFKTQKIATTTKTQINVGVKYGILVYEGDILVENGHKVFTAGLESQSDGFALYSGKNYTFIAYSINSNELPTVSYKEKLSTAKINSVSGDLLYYRHNQTLVRGNNNLKITLRHKFTLITTELKVGSNYKGKIQEIRDANFNNVSQNADIKLSDSTITYSSNKKYELINFENVNADGVSSITSSPNLLIANESNNTVTIAIPSIRVNGKTNSIPATTFNFQKGKKYKLTLTFNVPCNTTSTYGEVSVSSTVNLPNALLSTLTLSKPTTSTPAEFNFLRVDNSLNMYVNNQPIFTRQYLMVTRKKSNGVWGAWTESSAWTEPVAADMEGQFTDGQLVNSMQFTSSNANDKWGTNNNAEIWNIIGTDASPTIKISINSNGVVTIKGRKTATNTTLYNLYLRADYTLSTTNNTERTNAWFKRVTSADGNTQTAISKIRFLKNDIVWNEGSNTVLFSFEQSSQPTVGTVKTSGTTIYNNVICN